MNTFLNSFILDIKKPIYLEKATKDNRFAFDCIDLLHYKCHNVHLKRGGLHIDSPDWIKNKKASINSINKYDDDCFQ